MLQATTYPWWSLHAKMVNGRLWQCRAGRAAQNSPRTPGSTWCMDQGFSMAQRGTSPAEMSTSHLWWNRRHLQLSFARMGPGQVRCWLAQAIVNLRSSAVPMLSLELRVMSRVVSSCHMALCGTFHAHMASTHPRGRRQQSWSAWKGTGLVWNPCLNAIRIAHATPLLKAMKLIDPIPKWQLQDQAARLAVLPQLLEWAL
mmetsp:Transcript_106505/g.189366  ORF Transcript_106505/g.189366 Transcript_106505/m.189366 type:complete len:200 (+) Transcript_106505:493-1092(+)